MHYFVSGGAKLRPEPPTGFEPARTRAWAAQGHFVLVQIRGAEMRVTPVARARDGQLETIALNPIGADVRLPIVVRL